MSSQSISRRDFINGILISAGGVLLGGCTHFRPMASPRGKVDLKPNIGTEIGTDPRALRGGNLSSAFSVGHWMRDERLEFLPHSVKLSPSSWDSSEGSFELIEDSEHPDVVIAGAGISGLSSAFYISRQNPNAKILLLDANLSWGGNAGRDDASPIPVPAATAGAYAIAPYADFLHELYREIGLDWQSHIIPSPFYSYFFDDRTPFIPPNTRRWAIDVYGSGLKNLPYSPKILRDIESARELFISWSKREGAPTDPPDESDPKYDYLDNVTLHDYLIKNQGFHPAVSDFFTRFTIDALAGTTQQVSAYSGISFLGAEFESIFALPGGNSGITLRLLKWLIPDAVQNTNVQISSLDNPKNRVRVRQSAIALHANTSSNEASLVYFHDGKFHKIQSKALILATQAHSAQHIVKHLLDTPTREAWQATTLAPVVVANVTLKRAAPLVDLGVGYNQYWWGSKFWADFTIADWTTSHRQDRNRKTVLTFYGGNTAPAEEMPIERMKLMTRPFAEYEQSLREDLSRILVDSDFNFDEDVSAIYIYRWGHGMIYPKPGHLFGKEGGKEGRSSSPRLLARKQIGRISFAGQDTEGAPSIECAIASGLRCAHEILRFES